MSGLLVVGSVGGAPGVTTTALALAAGWPGGPVVLVECDPSGGDVGMWYGLAAEPGLLSWASAARGGRGSVWEHAQRLPGGLAVVPGPVGAVQARGASAFLAGAGGFASAAGGGFGVVADVGRLDPGSPGWAVLAVAGLAVLVARPRVAEVTRLAVRAEEVRSACPNLVVVFVGEPPWRPGEVERATGVPVAGVVPEDPGGAAAFAGNRQGRRGPAASRLGGAARELAGRLHARLAAAPPRPAALPPALPAAMGAGTGATTPPALSGLPVGASWARPALPASVLSPPPSPQPASSPPAPSSPPPAGPAGGSGGVGWVPEVPPPAGPATGRAAGGVPGAPGAAGVVPSRRRAGGVDGAAPSARLSGPDRGGFR